MRTARENAEALLSFDERERDAALLLIADRSLGCVDYHIGNNRTALGHLVKARTLYDEKTHAYLAVAYGQDLCVLTLCYTDFVQLSLGHYDESPQAGSEAIVLACRLGHPLNLCLALACHAFSTIKYRDPAATLSLTEECISIAREKGIAHWLAMAMIYRGWALAQIGSVDDGIKQICQGIDAWHAMGAGVALGLFFRFLPRATSPEGKPQKPSGLPTRPWPGLRRIAKDGGKTSFAAIGAMCSAHCTIPTVQPQSTKKHFWSLVSTRRRGPNCEQPPIVFRIPFT